MFEMNIVFPDIQPQKYKKVNKRAYIDKNDAIMKG